MHRSLQIVLTIILVGVAAFGMSGPASTRQVAAQQFPASAVIRGENIHLRAEPADNADVIALLQRGDAITITGAATTAGGEQFYPVDVVQTGESGWVLVLFVNPTSIAPGAAPAPQSAPEEPARGNQNRGNRNQENQENANQENGNQGGENQGNQETANQDTGNQENRNQRRANRQNRNQRNAEAAEPAPAPEGTPAPAPEENKAAPKDQELTFTGKGTATSKPVTLQPGIYVATATMEVSEPSGFLCYLKGTVNFERPLFNEQIDTPQSWTAEAQARISKAGDYVFECSKTNDPWTITLAPRQ